MEKETYTPFFRGISDFLWNLSGSDGKLVCPKHYTEHTGKNAYSIITDLFLYRQTGEEKYLERARRRALRVVGNLVIDPENGKYIFYPGRLGKRNMSNSVIDSGGATDSLSELLLQYGNRLKPEERKKIQDAVFKNSETYLKEAVWKKELPDQRLWGASGLASAYKIFKKPEWKEACLKSIERTLSQQWEDGTLPYHPNWKEYGLTSNHEETTPFYHSRQIGFIFHILDCLGESPELYRKNLEKAGNVFLAMYAPSGKKIMALETKRWYWFGQYEAAASGFDLYALMRLAEFTGEEKYLELAGRVWDLLQKHQQKDGGIVAQLGPGYDFQCQIFWNCHLAWLTRVIEFMRPMRPGLINSKRDILTFFDANGIIRYESPAYVALWRGKKRPIDPLYGPYLGGGSLLYFGRPRNTTSTAAIVSIRGEKDLRYATAPNPASLPGAAQETVKVDIRGRSENGWENVIKVEEWQEKIPLNFWFRRGRGWSPIRSSKFILREKSNLKALLYYLYVEILALNFPGIWRRTKDLILKLWGSGRGVYSSAWCTEPRFEKQGESLIFSLHPATRDGKELESVSIRRRYTPEADKLLVEEEIEISDKRAVGRFVLSGPEKELEGKLSFRGIGRYQLRYKL